MKRDGKGRLEYSDSRWRNRCAPIIQQVIKANADADERQLAKALLAAYPFGPRKYHPYKIWRDEIRRQLSGGKVPVFVDPKDTRKPVFGDRCDPYGDRGETECGRQL